MRNIVRQKQDVWFCEAVETRIGIDNVLQFSKPIHKKMSVSATSGVVQGYGLGLVASYDRYITSYDRDFDVSEGMFVFIDTIPVFNADGTLKLSNDGVNPITKPDYSINRILDTQKGTVARYGITKVGGSD